MTARPGVDAQEPDATAASRILAERARALAKPLEAARDRGDVVELLVFSVAGERYGIAAASVLEVIALREVVALPGTPGAVLGIVNHRGRVLPVVDLRRVFDLTGEGVAEDGRAVVVRAGASTLGVFADSIVGMVHVDAGELRTRSVTPTVRADRLLAATSDMTGVLDVEALVDDPRVTVNDEIA